MLGAVNPAGPHHFASTSGSTHAAKTRSRGASNVRSRLSRRPALIFAIRTANHEFSPLAGLRMTSAGATLGDMTHRGRSLAGAMLVLLTVLVSTASSAPVAAPSGTLTQISGRAGCLSLDDRLGCGYLRGSVGALHSVSISADGAYVYASDIASISVFRRDPVSGRLTQLRRAAGCLRVADFFLGDPAHGCTLLKGVAAVGAVTLGPEGRTAYAPVTTQLKGPASATVVTFSRDPKTGALRQSRNPPRCVRLRSNPECLSLRGFGAGA